MIEGDAAVVGSFALVIAVILAIVALNMALLWLAWSPSSDGVDMFTPRQLGPLKRIDLDSRTGPKQQPPPSSSGAKSVQPVAESEEEDHDDAKPSSSASKPTTEVPPPDSKASDDAKPEAKGGPSIVGRRRDSKQRR
jgi:hypothetical protein